MSGSLLNPQNGDLGEVQVLFPDGWRSVPAVWFVSYTTCYLHQQDGRPYSSPIRCGWNPEQPEFPLEIIFSETEGIWRAVEALDDGGFPGARSDTSCSKWWWPF